MKVKRSKEDKSKYDKFKVKPCIDPTLSTPHMGLCKGITTKKKKRLKYGQEYVNNYAEMLDDMK